jgi:hypothetical protein
MRPFELLPNGEPNNGSYKQRVQRSALEVVHQTARSAPLNAGKAIQLTVPRRHVARTWGQLSVGTHTLMKEVVDTVMHGVAARYAPFGITQQHARQHLASPGTTHPLSGSTSSHAFPSPPVMSAVAAEKTPF